MKRKFSPQFKAEAVQFVIETGRPIAEIARELEINEMHYRHIFATKASARFAVAEFIEVFYNRKRMHSSIGYRTPAQALTDYRSATLAA